MTDDALLNEFATKASEPAFAALIRRHADLVYATARRQVGNTALAEEITQNVFVALARKSGALRRCKTISGWLYRTTLLETRQALRAELRRQRRESVAGELHQISREGQSPWAAVVPLLDEALTRLRDSDRTAILLRFFEEQPFREIGRTLGISEDAAQKRVASSLTKLAAFFQERGFPVSCAGVGAAALFAEAHAAAPLHLVTAVTQGAVAAGKGAAAFSLGGIAVKLMHLTNPQFAAASALAVALMAFPVAYETQALSQARFDRDQQAARLESARSSARAVEARRDAAAQRLADTRSFLFASIVPARQAASALSANNTGWNDESPVTRAPKDLLSRLRINALDSSWKIRPALASVLALSTDQSTRLQQAVDGFLSEMSALEEAHLERLPDPGPAAAGQQPEPVRFRIHRYEPEANAARSRLRDLLRSFLGSERADLALRYLDFAPVDRPPPAPGEPLPAEDYFELSGHSSQRWNFHGYERTITLEPPSQIGLPPSLSVQMKFGGDSMGFGGDRHLLNPATAPSLQNEWNALAARPAPKAEPTP